MSAIAYTGLIGLTALERLVEVRLSLRNAAWSFARGGREVGGEHYPLMVILHAGLLVGCVAEVWLLQRPFVGWFGFPLLAMAAACQALRWWCITALGPRWNTRVITIPGLAAVQGGPYRWFKHPNYVAVVIEGMALPLIHGAWITALAFTVGDALLLSVRIRCENRALQDLRN